MSLKKPLPRFEDCIKLAEVYGEPCNNCNNYHNGSFCNKNHRQKEALVEKGHIPFLTVRKMGGCPDHDMKTGLWWHENPPHGCSNGYGGTKTNILC